MPARLVRMPTACAPRSLTMPLTRQLRLLVEHRRRTVADRTRLTNRLTALLKAYFPQPWSGPERLAPAGRQRVCPRVANPAGRTASQLSQAAAVL